MVRPVAAQILDDSTRQVYGPTTTRYRLESDLFNGIDTLYTLDTSYTAAHAYEFIQRPPYYHNLGELGTAAQPLFYRLPDIGHRLGVNVYDLYAFDHAADVRYFDTRSPYSSLYYVQGSAGQQWLTVDFSRNITPRWNFGIKWRRLSSNRQIAQDANRRQNTRADHHAVVIETGYTSENERYRLLVNYRHLNHRVVESGGLLPRPTDQLAPADCLLVAFSNGQELARLDGAATRDKRNDFHLYQQYDLATGGAGSRFAQLFHVLDRHWQRFSFTDRNLGFTQPFTVDSTYAALGGFYNAANFDSATTQHLLYSADWENTFGVKGRLLGLQYSLFYFRRDLRLDRPYLDVPYARSENYGGATLKYFLNDSNYVETEARYQLAGDYRLTGRFVTNWFSASWIRQRASPTFMQQFYLGNHAFWRNDFDFVRTDQIRGEARVRWRGLRLAPFAEINLINNHLFYDTEGRPRQVGERLLALSLGGTARVKVGHFAEELTLRVTQVSGPDVLRMPPLYALNRFYYAGEWFRALNLQLGFDITYRAAYYADAYLPFTGQYHLQNDFLLPAYPVVDLFANARIKRAIIFLRFSHVNQGFPAPGYFQTPYYPGMRRNFEFGIHWQFFD